VTRESEKSYILKRTRGALGLDHSLSRRDFLFMTGSIVIGMSALEAGGAQQPPLIIMDQANGVIIADPTRCVGCRRCELACTEFNDGKASPAMARIKVGRNLNFGVQGLYAGRRGHGTWGDGLVVPDLCKQCPHPVPCANACPNDAIVVRPPTNARVVDSKKCSGCKMCQRACPWEMMRFDSESNKATKCFLCDGNPKCVEACPAGALSYVPWKDATNNSLPRVAPTAVVDPAKARECNQCHEQ